MGREQILITGSSGFIGSKVIHVLKDRYPTLLAATHSDVRSVSDALGVQTVKIHLPEYLPDLRGIRTIIHCATSSNIQSAQDDSGLPLTVSGTKRLLDKAAEQGVKRFIYLSTFQVYGNELEGEIDEDTPPQCGNPYALNHYLGEEVCRYAARNYAMDIVVLRPSNVFGVPVLENAMRESLVPVSFVCQAIHQSKIVMHTSGKQQRNFISTGEVAEIISQLLDDFPTGFHAINAVSAWQISIRDIAAMVCEEWQRLTGKDLVFVTESDAPENPPEFKLSSRFFVPQKPLEVSLEEMCAAISHSITVLTQSVGHRA